MNLLYRTKAWGSAALALCCYCSFSNLATAQAPEEAVQKLKSEVAEKGWLIFSAKSAGGDFDLFACRPDGTSKRNLTRSPEKSEVGPRVAPDGRRMLYRSVAKEPSRTLTHDAWGAAGTLTFANIDGSNPQPQGSDGELPWASWSPDGKQLASLYKREGKIRIIDSSSKKVIRELPRQGIFQQMFWSADGKRFCGTANLEGQNWNIVCMDAETGTFSRISRNLCCTPDWFKGSPDRVIYSCRTPGLATDYGWTMLMQASADGKNRSLLYGERNRHIYYGCSSPDGAYVVFSTPVTDGMMDAEMAIIRTADAPIIVPLDYNQLQELYPDAKTGPVLRLGQSGFEPEWIYGEVPTAATKAKASGN